MAFTTAAGIDGRLLIPGEKGVHSGIPEAVFLEDVDSFMKAGDSAEEVLKKLDEQHQKFKFMLSNFDNKKKRLRAQVPDIATTLESVKVGLGGHNRFLPASVCTRVFWEKMG